MTESKKIFVSPHIDDVRKDLNLPEQVYIFDTTLRDGEQTPGISFTLQEKLTIAKQLDKLGINISPYRTAVTGAGVAVAGGGTAGAQALSRTAITRQARISPWGMWNLREVGENHLRPNITLSSKT